MNRKYLILLIFSAGFLALLFFLNTLQDSKTKYFKNTSIALNEFCGRIAIGTPKSDVHALVQEKKEFRFTSSDDIAFISFHTCHCTIHFTEDKVNSISKALCNN